MTGNNQREDTQANSIATEGVDADLADALLAAESAKRRMRMEEKLRLPHGYYDALEKAGSDWDFSIKLVVLIEAAIGLVIAAHLRHPVVVEHCERLGLDGKAGKLGLAQDLGLLQKGDTKAIKALAFVRNRFAHRVENIEADLAAYAKALTKGEMQRVVMELLVVPKEMEGKVEFLWLSGRLPELFRHIMWKSGDMILDKLARHDMKAEEEKERLKRIETGWLIGQGGLASLFKGQSGWNKLSGIASLVSDDQSNTDPAPV